MDAFTWLLDGKASLKNLYLSKQMDTPILNNKLLMKIQQKIELFLFLNMYRFVEVQIAELISSLYCY